MPELAPLPRRLHLAARFLAEEEQLASAIYRYLQDPRSGSSRRLLPARRPGRNATILAADDPDGRLLWVRAFAEHALPFFGLASDDDLLNFPVSFVTLISDKYAVDAAEKPPDPLRMTSWARQMLHGFSCLGMVEPAFYTEYRREIVGPQSQVISWHAHALVWGPDLRNRLRNRVAELTSKQSSMTASDPAHALRCTTTEQLSRRLFYLLKSPRNRYRIGKTLQPSKDPLRPVERRRLLEHLAGLYSNRIAVKRLTTKSRRPSGLKAAPLAPSEATSSTGVPEASRSQPACEIACLPSGLTVKTGLERSSSIARPRARVAAIWADIAAIWADLALSQPK